MPDGDYEAWIRGYEDWCVWYLEPENDERIRIISMETALTKDDKTFRLNEPCDPGCVAAYISMMWAPRDRVFVTRSPSKRKFAGRGTGYGNSRTIVAALKYVDRTLTGSSKLAEKAIESIMKEKKRAYKPRAANAFDMATVLPRAHQAIFAKEFEGAFILIIVWAIGIITSCFLRAAKSIQHGEFI